MKFNHSDVIIKLYPNNYTGLILVDKFADSDISTSIMDSLQESFFSKDVIQNAQSNSVQWQGLFRKMGASPDYSSSISYLVDEYNKNNRLPSRGVLVDFYNHYSLSCGIPMGAYDFKKIVGSLNLAMPGKGHIFTPLGSSKNIEKTKGNEVAYFDNDKIICRYWNKQDCDQTKITPETTNVLFIFDIFAENSNLAKEIFEGITNDFRKIFIEKMTLSAITGRDLVNELNVG